MTFRKTFLAFATAAAALAVGSAPEHFTASQLTSRRTEMLKGMKSGLASETLAAWGNHSILQAHREATGQAELHEKQSDILIVRAGHGSILVGGKVVDGKTSGPGEIRGSSVAGGEKLSFSAGDVVHIPIRTPHQVVLAPGESVDYLAVKVDAQ